MADQVTQPLRCERCGQELAADALFCPVCGAARARPDGDPLVGTIVADRYLLRQRLGQGNSGTIYLAEHTMLRRRVAVKVLHHELSRDDLAVERFRREATTVGEIDNEHIVEVLDFGRAGDGRLFLAMELLDGETLSETLRQKGRLPVAQVVDVLTQLGEALMEAHAMGYVHRDLRPRNVFLARRRGREGFVKLLDFGLAKLVEREGEAASTSLGMTFGDPRYMSPEQARGEPVDRRADIYSLGVMAYEMLTGRPPFVGERVFDVLTKHLEEDAAPPSQLRGRNADQVPAWLDAIVLRMLAKRPDERFVTVYRLVEALREGQASGKIMADDVARSSSALTPPPPATRPAARDAVPLPEEKVDTARVKRDLAAAAIAEAASAGPQGNMGMSGAWFADGEAAAEAADEDLRKTTPKKQEKPAKQPPQPEAAASTSWSEPQYTEEEAARRKKLFLIAGGVGGALLIGVVIIAFSGGGKKKPVAAAVVPDAGLAVPEAPKPDAAPPPPPKPIDAGPKKPVAVRPVRDPDDIDPHKLPTIVLGNPPRADAGAGVVEDPTPPQNGDAAQAEFYVKLGRTALQKGDAVGAAAAFNKAREFDAKNADAIAGIGEVALMQGYYDDAVVHLERAASLAPRSARIQDLLGQAYLGSGKPKQAAAAFHRALKLNPNDESAKKGLADANAQGAE